MARSITGLSASIIAVMLVSGTAFTPSPAKAEKMSKAEKAVVHHVKAECKAKAAEQAKGLGFVERWKSYSDCIHDYAKQHTELDFSDFD